MSETITYKCPGCGTVMVFDPDTQMLACPSCQESCTVNEYLAKYGNPQAGNPQAGNPQTGSYDNSGSSDDSGDQPEMKVYHCTSCGAELVSDEYTSATICGFCGNPTLVADRLDGEFKPKLIIPFKLDKDTAVEKFRAWTRKGPLTPGTLRSDSMIDKLTGIYVPFWCYDVHSTDSMHGTGLIVSREDHADYYYTVTQYYDVAREVSARFEKIPADASEKMNDDDMDKLEPFNYSELRKFEMPYLSGYLSERYNYTAEEMFDRIYKRTNRYIKEAADKTLTGYSSVTSRTDTPNSRITARYYALLPVWMLNYRYNGKDYTFLMNGQTGKIVADRPVSTGRSVAAFMITFVVTLIIAMIGGAVLW